MARGGIDIYDLSMQLIFRCQSIVLSPLKRTKVRRVNSAGNKKGKRVRKRGKTSTASGNGASVTGSSSTKRSGLNLDSQNLSKGALKGL